jgi:VWFA-related protein
MVFRLSAIAMAALLAQQPPPFRSTTRLVVLHVTVASGHGEPVTGLDKSAFTVYENGARQPIAMFRRDDVPVSMGLVIDNSGSMRSRRAEVESAALALARASNPDDEMFVLNFADHPRIDVPFTSDRRTLETQIARVDSIGGTALRDAIDMGEDYVQRGTRDRRVLVIVSDGVDNSSTATESMVIAAAQRRDIAIFAIGLNADRHARHDLDDLADKTGGGAYYPDASTGIEQVALEIAARIRTQYTVAYTPANQALDASYRSIRVSVAAAGRLTVRTRAGYWATPE